MNRLTVRTSTRRAALVGPPDQWSTLRRFQFEFLTSNGLQPEHRLLDYRGEKLVWDAAFRDDLLRSVARVGLEVEKALGAPQDVEGAVAGGKFHVVQTRPQVGLNQG